MIRRVETVSACGPALPYCRPEAPLLHLEEVRSVGCNWKRNGVSACQASFAKPEGPGEESSVAEQATSGGNNPRDIAYIPWGRLVGFSRAVKVADDTRKNVRCA